MEVSEMLPLSAEDLTSCRHNIGSSYRLRLLLILFRREQNLVAFEHETVTLKALLPA